jgi:hypothetical protein
MMEWMVVAGPIGAVLAWLLYRTESVRKEVKADLLITTQALAVSRKQIWEEIRSLRETHAGHGIILARVEAKLDGLVAQGD